MGDEKSTIGSKNATTTDPMDYDWNRTIQVCVVGLVWAGPISHHWYNVVERVVVIQHRMAALGARILADAIIFSPVAGAFNSVSIGYQPGLSLPPHL